MRNSADIRGMRTREQYKVMEFINLNFEPGALVDDETIRETDRNRKSMIFRWNQSAGTTDAFEDIEKMI